MAEETKENLVRKDETALVSTYGDRDPNEVLSEIIGSEFIEYRKAFDKAVNFETAHEFPVHIDFEINYGCNLKCPSCIFGVPEDERPDYEPQGKGRQMSRELFEKVILEGVPKGLKSIGLSYYNEPFLRKDCLDLIEWAMKQGIIDVHLSTNATIFTEALAQRILDLGIPRLSFSLDGISEETYAKARFGGNKEKTYGNILKFYELKEKGGYKLPLTRVSFVKTIINEHEVDDFIEFWQDKADYWAIQEFVTITPGQNYLKPKSHQVCTSTHGFRCPQPYYRLVIRSNGMTLPCCIEYGNEIPMGNAYEQSVESIWTSEKMVELRTLQKEGRYYEIDACKKCAQNTTGCE